MNMTTENSTIHSNDPSIGFSSQQLFWDLDQRRASDNQEITASKRQKEYSLFLRKGSRYYQIEHKDIAYVYTRETINVLVTKRGEKFTVYLPLSDLMKELDKKMFNRLSVELIASIGAIKGLVRRDTDGLSVELDPYLGLEFNYDPRYSSIPIEYSQLTRNNR